MSSLEVGSLAACELRCTPAFLGGRAVNGEEVRVSAVDELDGVIERCQGALREFVRGNP